jgi:hypothetical protein
MTRSSTVFADRYKSGYPKTDDFHGIWLGKFLATQMAARHNTEVVEREKLHPVRLKKLGH